MYARCFLLACGAFALSACAAVPMTAITKNGHTFRGTLTPGLPYTFQISDGRVACTGKFPTLIGGDRHSYTLPMACNNGLTGIVIFSDIDGLHEGGGGILRLSDGTDGTFITGSGAATL